MAPTIKQEGQKMYTHGLGDAQERYLDEDIWTPKAPECECCGGKTEYETHETSRWGVDYHFICISMVTDENGEEQECDHITIVEEEYDDCY